MDMHGIGSWLQVKTLGQGISCIFLEFVGLLACEKQPAYQPPLHQLLVLIFILILSSHQYLQVLNVLLRFL